MKRLITGALVGLIAMLAVVSTTAAADPANVRVGHGIPGGDLGLPAELPVDVLVNDSICLLEGFTFGEFAGPVELAPGTYNIKISVADAADPCSNDAVIEADVPFAAGEDATVLAHLDADGNPTASKFVDDLSRAGFFKSRLQVHHAAAAPTVDITLERPSWWRWSNQSLTIEDASNGAQAAAEVYPFKWDVSISPANTDEPVFETSLFVKPFRTYLIYAVGSVDTGSFTLLVEPVKTGSGFSWWR
ncbi:MAG TPA: DUF4397 domain-containing protein [Dehalococcoidia bacterium]